MLILPGGFVALQGIGRQLALPLPSISHGFKAAVLQAGSANVICVRNKSV